MIRKRHAGHERAGQQVRAHRYTRVVLASEPAWEHPAPCYRSRHLALQQDKAVQRFQRADRREQRDDLRRGPVQRPAKEIGDRCRRGCDGRARHQRGDRVGDDQIDQPDRGGADQCRARYRPCRVLHPVCGNDAPPRAGRRAPNKQRRGVMSHSAGRPRLGSGARAVACPSAAARHRRARGCSLPGAPPSSPRSADRSWARPVSRGSGNSRGRVARGERPR